MKKTAILSILLSLCMVVTLLSGVSAFAADIDAREVETSGSINVETTDTYVWDDLYTFTAPVAGTYTFNVPADLGFFNEDTYQNGGWYAYPDVDYYNNDSGEEVVVELEANEEYKFRVGAISKATWVITWTCVPAEGAAPTSGVVSVYITDWGTFLDVATFVAPAAGDYTFTIAAGMGAWDKEQCDNNPFGSVPYFDPYLDPDGGEFTVTLAEGETYEFYVNNPVKDVTVDIPWTFAAGSGSGDEMQVAQLGLNSIVIPEGEEGVNYSFTVELAGNYTFESNDLFVRVLDAYNNQVGVGTVYLEAGTYTLSISAMGLTGTFSLNITTDAEEEEPTLVLGSNTVTVEAAGSDFVFEVATAGLYKFTCSEAMSTVYSDGMMVGRNEVYLDPGTYTVTVWSPMGAGTYTVNVTVEAAAVEDPQEAANEVMGMINAIGEVTLDSETAIQAARSAYDALSDEAKALVTNLQTLVDAEAELENLKGGPVEPDGTEANPFPVTVPGTITGAAGSDTYYTYTATEDCVLDIIFVAGKPYISGINATDIENGKRVELTAGQTIVINPWGSTEDFELSLSLVDLSSVPGSASNPEEVDSIDGLVFTVNNSDYYYKWTATESGTLTITLSTTWGYGYNLMVNGEALYGNGETMEIEVAVGDEIVLVNTVYASADSNGSITLSAEFGDGSDVPPAGDYTFLVFALMAMSMTALVVLVSKKRSF